MRKAAVLCALIGVSACFLFGGPDAVAVLIDFEDAPGNEIAIGTYYAGLTFAAGDEFWEYAAPGHNTAYTIHGDFGAWDSGGVMGVTWDQLVGSVGFLLKAHEQTVTVNAYSGANGTGALLDSDSVTTGEIWDDVIYSLAVSATGIKSIVVHDSGGYWCMDDLTFEYGDQDIPEPATLALLALGGVAAFLRRR